MKRLLLILVAFLLVPKIADASTLINGLYYELNSSSQTATVTYKNYDSSQNSNYVTGKLVIPEKVAYGEQTYSVTSIGRYAFEGCRSLTSVVIPNSVTSIGYSSFSECSGLTSVTIGSSVTEIDSDAFEDCNGLTRVEISDLTVWCNIQFYGNTSNPLYYAGHLYLNGTEIKDLVIPNSITSIGKAAFSGCSGLKSVEIPNSVTSIGYAAFYRCSGLKSVVIPNSVTSIGNNAFWYCSGLTSVEIPNSVTSIGNYAFEGCGGLTSVEIPNSVTSIGNNAFSSCSGLTSVTIPNSVTSIGERAFEGCSGLTSVEIGNSVTSIGEYAFSSCRGLKSVEIPNSVTSIGSNAFWYCSGLTSVEIGNSVTSIGSYAFSGCSSLTSVEIGNSVTKIGYEAFYRCSSLSSIEIPTSVTSIGGSAFEYCRGLSSVTIGSSVTEIGTDAFRSCSLEIIKLLASTPPDYFNAFNSYVNSAVLYIPLDTYDVYMATDWRSFATIIEGSGLNTGTFTVDGITYRYKDNEASVIRCENTVTLVNIPERLTANTDFGMGSFTVTGIEKNAFSGCSRLQSVTIPASCITVGEDAFSNCTGLAMVTCVGITPPECASTVFSGTDCQILVVKENAVRAYQTAQTWKDFNFILGLEGTGAKVGIANIDGFSYLYMDNEAYLIRSYSYSTMTSVEIPGEIKVSDASGTTLTSKVTTILDNALMDSNNLTTLTIPSSITAIGNNAFGNCSRLTTVNSYALEPPVCVSNSFAEAPCTYLHVLPQAQKAYQTAPVWKEFRTIIGDLNSFEYNRMKYVLNETNNTAELIMVDESVTVANIPSSVTKDGKTYSVTSIAQAAFDGCDNLSSITIPESVTVIYGNCFKELNSLKTITINEGDSQLYVIGKIEVDKLEILTLGRELYEGKTQINGENVECNPSFANFATLTSLNFGKKIKTILKKMFSGCINLRSVTIPGNIEFIGDEAFANCIALKSINLEDSESPVTIESATTGAGTGTTFGGAPIETIYLGRNVEYVGTELSPFKNLETLTTLTIGNKTTRINDYLFYGCRNIEMMSVPSSVTYIGGYSFYDCSTAKLLTISSSVETIGEYAFYNCRGLSTLTIPSSVVTIGDYAFRSCSGLTSISIGDGVKTIGKYAFLDCYVASKITIGNSVQTIGENAFYNCQSWPNIVIPNSVVTIGANAFALCQGAVEITIGSGVKSVGERAFADCDYITKVSSLSSVPPVAYDNSFTSYNATLYVPQNALNLYKTSTCWRNFKTIVNDLPMETPATGITITPSTPSELTVGQTLQLTAAVSPENATNKTVTWESSNSGVAIVNNHGLVTAVAPGTVIITASDAYGHNALVIITVIAAEDSGLETIVPEAEKFYILTVDGILIKENATQEDINTLAPGLYIIGGKKVIIR